MLTELLNQNPDFTPGRWTPCPPVSDRDAWDTLPGFDRLLAAGNAAAREGRKVPPLPLSLWLRFIQKGERVKYEAAYFARRRTLARLTLAEALSDAGQFLPQIADYVWAICEESAWQLPAHNSYIRDTPQLPLPDTTRPVVDLFAAETGALLAMVHYLLGPALDEYAPGLCARLVREVEARILRPWRTEHFWWMGHEDEPMCNWTPWCTQNCLIAQALLHPHSTAANRAAVARAAYSLDCFLKDYGEDGACSEGAQYYSHAALCLYNALDILCAMAPGVFDAAWSDPKLRAMGEYISNVHAAGPYYLNFADCSPLAGARGAREYLFGRRVNSRALMALAAADFVRWPDGEPTTDSAAGINLFYMVQAAFAEEEIRAFARVVAHEGAPVPGDAWYPSIGLRVCRRGAFVAGMKAGNNADSHNHNDTGSVTLYKDGRPLLIDLGVESYTQKTFSPQRYEIWTMQSSWHNLPEFDPEGQKYQQLPGAEFAARDVTAPDGGLCMDIAPAYGSVPGLGYYRRRLHLDEAGLHLADETDYPGTVALTLMSVEEPAVQEGNLCFGALGYTPLPAGVRAEISRVPVTDPRLRGAWPEAVWRIRLYFTGALELTIG